MRYLIFLFLLIATPAFAGPEIFLACHPAAGGGSCSTAKDDTISLATNDLISIGYDDTVQMIAGNFAAGSSYTLCKISLRLTKGGSPTFGIKVGIYTDNSGVPGTLIGTASDEILSNTLAASEATVTFSNLSAALTSGTRYWIVIYKSSGSFNYYNDYVSMSYYGSGTDVDLISGWNGSAWSAGSGYTVWKKKTFSN